MALGGSITWSPTRAEAGSVIVTTNLPFSEWVSVFTDPRLCKAVVERLTYRSHIIETGTESYRFKRSLGQSKSAKPAAPTARTKKRAAESAPAAPDDPTPTADTSDATDQESPDQ